MADPIFLNPDAFTAADDLVYWQRVGAITALNRSGNVFDLRAAAGPAPQITILSPTMFRLRFSASGDYSQDFSYALPAPAAVTPTPIAVTETATVFQIDTGVLRLEIVKAAYALTVYLGAQVIHQDAPRNLVYVEQSVASFKLMPTGAHYYGFGEKAGMSLNKRGSTMTFFNYDNFSYDTSDEQAMYVSIPFLIETNPVAPAYSYGLFLDNPSQTYIDLGQRIGGQYYLGAVYGEINTYFMYGPRVPDVLRQYVELTGRSPIPPKYVFGYHQGAYGYNVGVGQGGPLGPSRQTVMAVAQSYRDNLVPCDGLHLDVDFQHEYRMFTAGPSIERQDPVDFGDPVVLLRDLHALGFKCSTNITPMIRDDFGTVGNVQGGAPDGYPSRDAGFQQGAFLRNPGGIPSEYFTGKVDYGTDPISNQALGATGFYADMTNPAARQWYGQQYGFLINTVDMDMIWQDMTDPAIASGDSKTMRADLIQYDFGRYTPHVKIHNAYAITLLQATYEGLNALRGAERNFIIARGGYAGLQRYAGLWTGDSSSDWAHYTVMLPMILNLGLSGVPISGCDIGGFANGPVSVGNAVSAELLTRWMTLGAFLPWYRNHYDAYTKSHQEPFNYGAGSQADPKVLPACRKYINLRYQLLQLFYDLMWEARLSGMPIARALFLHDPDDTRVYEDNWSRTEFFLGRDVLVAPVMTQGVLGRTVYLPKNSDWYELEPLGTLGQQYAGGSNWMQPADWDVVPAYVRDGAIIPFRPLEQYVGELPSTPLTLTIWPGRDQVYSLYQDDGHSTLYETGNAYRCTQISTTGLAAGGRSVRVRRTQDNYVPRETYYFISLLGYAAPPSSVTAGGIALGVAADADALDAAGQNQYFFDAANDTVTVKIFDVAADIAVVILP